ncbi:MAG: mitochondrial fission ELM1 family protein [Gammaproteobacteria bacterium]|nr:mitochondrial fission ELM1 family protein [Gammaproteobacteria bacterium]
MPNPTKAAPPPLVIWHVSDGKAGHDQQARGLIQALSALTPVTTHQISLLGTVPALYTLLDKHYPDTSTLPTPQLLIGAGHATHLSLLAARRCRGGRIIVLMRPSLPCSWFDLCLIPEHDRPRASPHIIVTQGALNAMRRGTDKQSDLGVLLIGGPSPHVRWSDAQVVEQIAVICRLYPAMRWQLTTSRRTPTTLLPILGSHQLANLLVTPYQDCGPDWMRTMLGSAAMAWITADSVSMIYEALTAGCACGIIELDHRTDNRVTRGLSTLQQRDIVSTLSQVRGGQQLRPPDPPFNEAARCAQLIYRRWLSHDE